MSNILKQSADFVRTAPLGLAFGAVNLSQLGREFAETGGLPEIHDISTSFPIAGLALSGIIVARSMKQRRHIEHKIKQCGFDETFTKDRTNAWCARQIGTVVCRNSGDLDRYKKLYENNPDRQFKWLPNF
jgi:hypothetical protein